MKLDSILAARRADPFKPFSIHTGSGQTYRVTDPENMATHEQAGMVMILSGPGKFALLDLENLTEVTFQT